MIHRKHIIHHSLKLKRLLLNNFEKHIYIFFINLNIIWRRNQILFPVFIFRNTIRILRVFFEVVSVLIFLKYKRVHIYIYDICVRNKCNYSHVQCFLLSRISKTPLLLSPCVYVVFFFFLCLPFFALEIRRK